jgi:hypothetical protein
MAITWKKLAFADEVAALSDEDPHDIGTAAAEGVATDASRHDHVHKLGADSINSGDLIADDVIGSEHIEALSAPLDFAKQQATAMALDNQTSNPAAPVVGQIYFHTGAGELHPYICTVAA